MSDVLKSIRLDYYTLKANYKTLILIYVLAIFLAIFTQPPLTIVIVIMFSTVFSSLVFSISEKNNLSKLYGILPFGKAEFVIGRYLYALLFGIINEIAGGILAYIVSIIVNKGMSEFEFTAYLAVFFLYFCMSIGISFVIYFKYGFSKAYIFTMLPLYVVAMSGIFISRNENNPIIKHIIQYLVSNPAMIWLAGIGLGLMLLIISCSLSCAYFKSKDF